MSTLQLLASLTPIISVLVFLVLLKLPAAKAMPIAMLATGAAALFIWQMDSTILIASIFEGLLSAITPLTIIFGALFLLNTLKYSGAMNTIRAGFTNISADARVQVIIICWLFGSFIEGSAGFGTPAAIAAPLLVLLGVPPIAAAVLALIADSTAVSFGAIGLPVLFGMEQGLMENGVSMAANQIAVHGGSFADYAQYIAMHMITIDLITGSLLPLVLVCTLTFFFGRNRSLKEGLEIWRFAIFSGFAFTLPAWLINYYAGPEFPSVIGALVGMAIVIPVAKKGWLLPVKPWADFTEKGSAQEKEITQLEQNNISQISAWSPYLIMALLLIFSRVFQPFKDYLNSFNINWQGLLGTELNASFAILYAPGIFFIIVCLFGFLLFKMNSKAIKQCFTSSFSAMLTTTISLGTSVPMVKIFLNSAVNDAGLPSMPVALADLLANTMGNIWLWISPIVGIFGAFLSGSATFSNMMFSGLQFTVAEKIAIDQALALALQGIGANAGNMMSVMNVVAAAAVVGMAGRESEIIRKTMPIAFVYALVAGTIAMLFYG